MILNVNGTLINLATMTTAIVERDHVRFAFTVNEYSWHNEQLTGSEISTMDFTGEEAAAIHSYVSGFVYGSVSDHPFVDVMAHYAIARERAGQGRRAEAEAFGAEVKS